MGAHSITLHLPDPLYDHFKNQAKRARRSLEAELLRVVVPAPTESDRLFRLKPTVDSDGIRPLIPIESGHFFEVVGQGGRIGSESSPGRMSTVA